MLSIAAIVIIVVLIGIIALLVAAKRPFIVINIYNIHNMNQTAINGNGNFLNTGSDSTIYANIKMADETNGESSRQDAKSNIRGKNIFNWCGKVLISVLANILASLIKWYYSIHN